MPSMQYVYDDFTNLQSKVILSFDNIIVHLQSIYVYLFKSQYILLYAKVYSQLLKY